jgi:hypothetical protein
VDVVFVDVDHFVIVIMHTNIVLSRSLFSLCLWGFLSYTLFFFFLCSVSVLFPVPVLFLLPQLSIFSASRYSSFLLFLSVILFEVRSAPPWWDR